MIFILSPPIPHIETMASIFIKCSLLDITKKNNNTDLKVHPHQKPKSIIIIIILLNIYKYN